MPQRSNYHPFVVALHWLLALLVPTALVLGVWVMAKIPNNSPMKVDALRGHMAGGILILVLMLLRLIVRFVADRPAPASTGSPVLDGLAWASHRLFYIAVVGMAAVGLLLANESGILGILIGKPAQIPADFWVYNLRVAHYLIARFLMLLIALHVAGVLHHTLIRKDGLLRRMWFGGRVISASEAERSRAGRRAFRRAWRDK